MSSEKDYEVLFQFNTSPYTETKSWVLPNTFKETFPKKQQAKFIADLMLKKVPFVKDGQFPQYK